MIVIMQLNHELKGHIPRLIDQVNGEKQYLYILTDTDIKDIGKVGQKIEIRTH